MIVLRCGHNFRSCGGRWSQRRPGRWRRVLGGVPLAGRFGRVEPRGRAGRLCPGCWPTWRQDVLELAEQAGHARPDAMQRLLTGRCGTLTRSAMTCGADRRAARRPGRGPGRGRDRGPEEGHLHGRGAAAVHRHRGPDRERQVGVFLAYAPGAGTPCRPAGLPAAVLDRRRGPLPQAGVPATAFATRPNSPGRSPPGPGPPSRPGGSPRTRPTATPAPVPDCVNCRPGLCPGGLLQPPRPGAGPRALTGSRPGCRPRRGTAGRPAPGPKAPATTTGPGSAITQPARTATTAC